MTSSDPTGIHRLLSRIKEGDAEAFNALYNKVYTELKMLATKQRAQWNGDFTLNTTALVHEAYEKIVKSPNKSWENEKHFYRVAAKAMRQILYTYAESKRAHKRGGDVKRVLLEDATPGTDITFSSDRAHEVISMEEAMIKLEEISPREAQIVEYRFYLGLTVEETANILGVGSATVKRGWAMAKAWLYKELK